MEINEITLRNGEIVQKNNLPVHINIGCGFDKRDGFLNVDLNDFHAPDLIADACNLHLLPDGHFKLIIAQDVLEHLERSKTQMALDEWARICSDDGVISIRVPSLIDMFYLLVKPSNRNAEAAESIVHLMYGTQAYTGDYHLAGFTAEILNWHLKRAGLMVARASMRDEWMFDIDARKTNYLQSNQEYVHSIYFSLLGRPVDSGALVHWTAVLNAGKITREQVEWELLSSEEHRMLETLPRYMQRHLEMP